MTIPIAFRSCFAQEMNDFLVLKESTVGESANSTYRFDLFEFDTYLADNDVPRNGLTENVVTLWIASFKDSLHRSNFSSDRTSVGTVFE